ncbi:uncharacterized protein LOC144907222 [Branchiostoma floridae x Branchiostoma belcheri]
MGYKLAMLLGVTSLLLVLAMVDQAESACCRAEKCRGWWKGRWCRCGDGTGPTPYCGYGPCNIFGCNCRGGCRRSKRSAAGPAEARLESPQGENAMPGGGFEDHDADQDMRLSKEEALEMLKKMGTVDIANLPDDWFTSLDTNGNGYIDPEEYDSE